MPWSGATFASRHNKKLHGEKADHAARIANAALRSGVPEGESIAIASKWAKNHVDGGDVESLQTLVTRLGVPKRANGGFLAGATPGRADSIRTAAPGGSYVIPADVVSGLGQGNSPAGARIIQDMLTRGPYGVPLPKSRGTRGPPRPPASPQLAAGGTIPLFRKKGGATSQDETPVLLSDGEFVVTPEHVLRWGGGNLKRGHRVFAKWVLKKRAAHIAKLKSLKPPVKT